jgi:hypothetical protein
MPCPRCEAEVDPCARVCPACALPLALGDEPAPVPLARMIALDRRGPGRSDLHPAARPERGAGPADVESKRPEPDRDRGLDLAPRVRAARPAALRLVASLALDVLLVVAAAAVPLAVASSGVAAAPGALGALIVPAAGFVALVAAAYVLLSRALLGATPGRLAVARAARGGPSGSARGHPADARAP